MKVSAQVNAHISTEKYRTAVTAGKNMLISDEPVSQGGQETGFNPFELLAASLASCTCATLRMYADRKGWAVEGIDTAVQVSREESAGATVLKRTITLSGQLDEAQRQRMLSIANACPVHKILSGSIEVRTGLE